MNPVDTCQAYNAAAFAMCQKAMEAQMQLLREMTENNLNATRAAMNLMQSWQSMVGPMMMQGASPASLNPVAAPFADYPMRTAQLCMRAAESWLNVCTEQSKHLSDTVAANLAAAANGQK